MWFGRRSVKEGVNKSSSSTLDDTTRSHLVCYCCDCRAYAQQLQQADILLDEHGGTELVQTYLSNMQIIQGYQHIVCLPLSEKGIYRWHTSCCNTPIGNTAHLAKLPFVGIPVAFMWFESATQKSNCLGKLSFRCLQNTPKVRCQKRFLA